MSKNAHYLSKTDVTPGTKKDAGTAIRASKLSPGFRMVLYYVKQLAAAKTCTFQFLVKLSVLHSKTCICLKTCSLQFPVKHRVLHMISSTVSYRSNS